MWTFNDAYSLKCMMLRIDNPPQSSIMLSDPKNNNCSGRGQDCFPVCSQEMFLWRSVLPGRVMLQQVCRPQLAGVDLLHWFPNFFLQLWIIRASKYTSWQLKKHNKFTVNILHKFRSLIFPDPRLPNWSLSHPAWWNIERVPKTKSR